VSRPLPTDDDLHNLLAGIRAAVDDFEAGVLYVANRKEHKRFTVIDLRDRCAGDELGYPRNSISGGPGSNVVDDELDPKAFAAAGDRVGELAVFGEHDSLLNALEAVLVSLEGARVRIDQATTELKDAVPPPPPPDQPGCVSCARIPGNFSPIWEVYKAGERCQFCASWKPEEVVIDLAGRRVVVKRKGEDLPLEAIEFHQLRRNLTTKFWRELAATRVAQAEAKKAKRKGKATVS
jgi:hypothetical protein